MSRLNKFGILLFLLAGTLFSFFTYRRSQGVDGSGPVMTIDSDVLEISVKDSAEALLQGITATDRKDGDVTESVVLESLSAFIDTDTRLATYAAFDSDKHVTRGARRIVYTDYTKPEFSMTQDLEYPTGRSDISINGIKVQDCIDGDISSFIKVKLDPAYDIDEEGEYETEFSIVNSAGDKASFKAYITIYDNAETKGPQFDIVDNEYLIYLDRGDAFYPFDYIEDVKIGGRKYNIVEGSGNYGAEEIEKGEKIVVGRNQIDVEGEVDTETPGEYVIKFSMTVDAGNQETVTGSRRIYVMVRDN